jgi:hypothetical protein
MCFLKAVKVADMEISNNDTRSQKCMNCKYYYGSYDFSIVCNYLFVTGRKRPCEPGDKCTVMIPRKRKRKIRGC